jgi:hypothetical protein
MSELKAVELIKRPPLTDIPARLRQLAEDYESGRQEMPEGVIIVEHPIIGLPATFGKVISMSEAIGILFMTSQCLTESA